MVVSLLQIARKSQRRRTEERERSLFLSNQSDVTHHPSRKTRFFFLRSTPHPLLSTGNLLRPPPLLRHAPPRPCGRGFRSRHLLDARGPGLAQSAEEFKVGRRGRDAGPEAVEEGGCSVRRRRRRAAVPGDGREVPLLASQRPGELQLLKLRRARERPRREKNKLIPFSCSSLFLSTSLDHLNRSNRERAPSSPCPPRGRSTPPMSAKGSSRG